MPNRKPLAESLLVRSLGPERAAAIYGDLLELAATRGRLWFWAESLRTLIEVSWRAPVAFFCGVLATLGFMENLFRVWRHHTPEVWRFIPAWFNLAGPLVGSAAVNLWFLLPYALIRYGREDRFVRLTAALALATTITFLYIPWVSPAFGVLVLLIAASASLQPIWRRPLLIVSAATVTGFVGFTCVITLRLAMFAAHLGRPATPLIFRFAFAAVLAVEACVCSKAYRALLDQSHRTSPISYSTNRP